MGSLFSQAKNSLILHVGTAERQTSNLIKTTSYNIFTFLPQTIVATLVQFRRLANVYFLVTAVLQFIPIISPLSPGSAIAPLIFVLVVSLIRSAFQEIGKYRYDREANSSIFEVFVQADRNENDEGDDDQESDEKQKKDLDIGEWQTRRSDQLHVGDIIRINQDQRFPSDIILLSSSNPDGKAYIQTSSLDGEKNLKQRSSLPFLQPHYETLEKIQRMSAKKPLLTIEQPNEQLYNFNGMIEYTKTHQKPIYGKRGKKQQRCSEFVKINQLLYRQSVLKNTKFVVGVIAYVGKYTKSMMNSTGGTSKMSKLERKVNFYMLFIFGLQFLLILLCGLLRIYLFYSTPDGLTYFTTVLKQTPRNYALEAVLTSCSYFILLNTMIPISLLVSIQIVKFGQGMFINYDKLISRTETDGSIQYARVFRSVINQELGMVEYVFTDKTGTLTKNQMLLKQVVIGNQVYSNQPHPKTKANKDYFYNSSFITPPSLTSQQLSRIISLLLPSQPSLSLQQLPSQLALNTIFLLIMSLCHECLFVPAGNQGNQQDQYHGSSPDQITLVDSAARAGLKFVDNNNGKARLQVGEHMLEVLLHDVFQFDSDRKRMSVIVEVEGLNGYKIVLTKGADSSIDKLLLPQYKQERSNKFCQLYKKIQFQITQYSKQGLRTLLLGFKIVPNHQYLSLKQQLLKNSDNQAQKQQLIGRMQQNIHLCGATIVEDKLQDQVQSTIEDIIRANIKICMLTGDKLETAENIAKSCKLFENNWKIVRIQEKSGDVDIFRGYCSIKDKIDEGGKFGVIVEGGAITKALESVYFKEMFQNCSACVCCRITPKNKAQVVLYTKQQLDKLVLSIGDGANDVPMIQAANIGIGLYGNEGMNAVQASDFAIPQFKGLWRLLFVHGRWNYIRIAQLIKYFFYKNLVFTLGQLWYAYVCGFSAQSIYDATYLVLFNTIFTGGPVIVRALLEQDLNYIQLISQLEEQVSHDRRQTEQLQQKLLPPPTLPLPTVAKLLSIETVRSITSKNVEQMQKKQKEKDDERFDDKSNKRKVNKVYIDQTLKNLFPMLYQHSQKQLSLTPRLFAFLIFQATIQSFCIFLTIYFGIEEPELSMFSICLYSVVLALVTIRICYDITYWTWLMVCAILFTSLIPYILFIYLMSIFQFQLTGTFIQIFKLPDFYVCLLLALGLGTFLQSTFSVLRKYYFPTIMDTVRKQWQILKSKEREEALLRKQQRKQKRRQTIRQQYFDILQSNRSMSSEYSSRNQKFNYLTNKSIEIEMKEMRLDQKNKNYRI